MEVRLLGDAQLPEWDRVVAASPSGTLFHQASWLQATCPEPHILGLFEGGRLCGGFVGGLERRRLVGAGLVRPPLTPYSGLVVEAGTGKRSANYTAFKNGAKALIEGLKRDYAFVETRLGPGIEDLQPFIWTGFKTTVRYTYVVPLQDIDLVWAGFDQNRRANITRAERSGVRIERGGGIVQLASVFRAVRDDPAAALPLLQRVQDAVTRLRCHQVFTVRDPVGEAVGALLLVWDHRRAYYLLGGHDESRRSEFRGAMDLGFWEAMKFAKGEIGLSEFDLEGSMIPGVELYFRRFGGRQTPFHGISWDRPLARRLKTSQRWVSRLSSWLKGGR